MSLINNNQGDSCGVQQPKWKRKIHSAHHQWRKQQWDDIMKTTEDYASDTNQTSHWPLVNLAQQEGQNVKGSHDCDLSPSAVFKSALSNQVAATVLTSPRSCVFARGPPPHPHVEYMEMPTAVAPMVSHVLQPSNDNTTTQNGSIGHGRYFFSGRLDSSSTSPRSTIRISAATFEKTPSIFRKRKREHFSAKGSGEDDTYEHIDKSHLCAENSCGDPEPKLLNLFQLEPDLKTVKENSNNEQFSLSALVLRRESGLQQLDLYDHSLGLLGDQGGECSNEDTTTTFQSTFEGPPILSIVSSEGSSQKAVSSSYHQSSSEPPLNPYAISLLGNARSLDSAKKLVSSDWRSVYMDKGLSISAVEISNGSASAASSWVASRRVSPSTHATPSRAASKKDSLFSCSTPPMAASKKVSPSISASPSGRITTPSVETLLQQKIGLSNSIKRRSNQNNGPLNQKELSPNQTRRRSNQVKRSSDLDTRLAVPEGTIKSSFKGVGYFKRTKRWEAHIWNTEESRQEYLGAFHTEEQAARAYDRATLYFRGVGAKLHFKLEDYREELSRLEALTKDQLTTMLKKQSKGRGSLNPAYPA